MPTVQIILHLWKSVNNILCNFDIDVCCMAYLPAQKRVVCLPRALRAIRYGANLVDTNMGGDSYTRYYHDLGRWDIGVDILLKLELVWLPFKLFHQF